MKKTAFLAALVLLVLLAGCYQSPQEGPGPLKIEIAYYVPSLRENADFPVAHYKYDIDSFSGLRLIQEALDLLLVSPSPERMETIFPEQMSILALSLEEGAATVDLSEHYISAQPPDMRIMDYCIISTLTALESCDSVRLFVSGSSHPVYGDTYLTLQDFIIGEELLEPQPVKVFVYFPSPQSGMLRRETHSVRMTGGRSGEQYVLEELIKGPVSEDLSPAVPEGTELLSIHTEDGVCFVNLNEDFVINQTGNDSEIYRTIYSIVNSLTELEYIRAVRFLISGEAIRYYHGIYVNEPLARRTEYIGGW